MKKLLLFPVVLFFSLQGISQLLSWAPEFATESADPFTITMDAGIGNKRCLTTVHRMFMFILGLLPLPVQAPQIGGMCKLHGE